MTAITTTTSEQRPAAPEEAKAPYVMALQKWSVWLCCTLCLIAGLSYWIDRPFSQLLVSKTVSISELSPQQRMNIQLAAKKLNGTVIKSGAEFSFNKVVGRRSERRGYLYAPVYVGKNSPLSAGGGICVVSSILYQDAIASGFEVTERVAHNLTIHSIPPGLDATVWYSGADLRFRNTLKCPVEIVTTASPYDIKIDLFGNPHQPKWQAATINRKETLQGRNLRVVVSTTQNGCTTQVTDDYYGIPTTGERHR